MSTQEKPQKELSEKQLNLAFNVRKKMFVQNAEEMLAFLKNQNEPQWWLNRSNFMMCARSFNKQKREEYYAANPEKRIEHYGQNYQNNQQATQSPQNVTQQIDNIPSQVTTYGHNPAPQSSQPVNQSPQITHQVQENHQSVNTTVANEQNNSVQPVPAQKPSLSNNTPKPENQAGNNISF